VWFGVNLFGPWIVLPCQFMTWQISYLLFWTMLLLVFPRQQLTCSKYLLRWLVINFGFLGTRLIMIKLLLSQSPQLLTSLSLNTILPGLLLCSGLLRFGRNLAPLSIRWTMMRPSALLSQPKLRLSEASLDQSSVPVLLLVLHVQLSMGKLVRLFWQLS
jgi:hypothetical protein